MNDEEIRKIIDSPDEYDELKEESYISWANFWFRKTQRWAIVLVFAHFLFFITLATLCGILFLLTHSTKYQIMYAAFFVCLVLIGYLIKVFAWVMASRNIISREIKRLELRIAELNEAITNK